MIQDKTCANEPVIRALRLLTRVSLVLAISSCTRAQSDGPEPIAWDREPCANCRMHIGEPAFAVQLQTRDGQVLNFDDPGCYVTYLAQHPVEIQRVFFHDVHADRWLTADRVAFVTVPRTPMGYGLGAVAAGTANAITLEQARERVLSAQQKLRAEPPTGAPRAEPHTEIPSESKSRAGSKP